MNEGITIRGCRSGDEDSLALIGQATFLETFAGILSGSAIVEHCSRAHSAELYREWISDPCYSLRLVEKAPGGAPIGFMVLAPPDLPIPFTDCDLELKRIYLLSKFQGAGIGGRLVETAIDHSSEQGVKRLLLGVYANNMNAIGFYERSGFRQIGTRKFKVGGVDYDDNIMEKVIDIELP
ncbi:GNAT family N-acetyltransferase [bacterium]|nr:GNAT family N-acetyltransferase [bacterium]